MRLEASVEIRAPRAAVWRALTDWEGQAAWMVDVAAIEVVTARRAGRGVTLRVPTRVFGVTVEDRLRVTEWREPERVVMVHLGPLIDGVGAFELAPTAAGTRVTWWEEIEPPLGRLGEWAGSTVVRPVTERLFRRSLANLRARCEARTPA